MKLWQDEEIRPAFFLWEKRKWLCRGLTKIYQSAAREKEGEDARKDRKSGVFSSPSSSSFPPSSLACCVGGESGERGRALS